MQKKNVLFCAGCLVALNFLAWREIFVLNSQQYLTVDFLDVGQGDSAFIETPGGHQILIDGGPDSSALQKLSSLMPFWDRDLDLVILTHPESDHMNGLFEILKRYKADYILWTGVKRSTSDYKVWTEVLDKQAARGAKVIVADAGNLRIKAGNVFIDTLYPLEKLEGREFKNTTNETAIVSKINFGVNSFLFTGDIGFAVENQLVNSAPIKSNVLKVAHHGSKYSTSDNFLSAVGPEVAVISVGGKNRYGHPTGEVLQKLEKFGIKIFRTDKDGDVKMASDGNNISIKLQ